ncbi:MAG: hypothetical protein ACYS8Z_18830 [Planctomycetota bacterium]
MKDQYQAAYPHYTFNVWSSGEGSLTSWQGHDLGIECGFPGAEDTQADCVALSIAVKHLTTEAELYGASVDWGEGSAPDIDIELIWDSVPFTDESLEEIEGKFNLLEEVFQKAVEAWENQNR